MLPCRSLFPALGILVCLAAGPVSASAVVSPGVAAAKVHVIEGLGKDAVPLEGAWQFQPVTIRRGHRRILTIRIGARSLLIRTGGRRGTTVMPDLRGTGTDSRSNRRRTRRKTWHCLFRPSMMPTNCTGMGCWLVGTASFHRTRIGTSHSLPRHMVLARFNPGCWLSGSGKRHSPPMIPVRSVALRQCRFLGALRESPLKRPNSITRGSAAINFSLGCSRCTHCSRS
jgi:hypothetical protein